MRLSESQFASMAESAVVDPEFFCTPDRMKAKSGL
jgi:hypothetical protein